jgi:hypothetical protein
VLLLVAAIVVDFGVLRGRAVSDQTAADLAALAAGAALADREPARACQDALDSLHANLPDAPSVDTAAVCAPMASTACSTPSGAPTVTATANTGRYVLSMTYPVVATQIADPVFGAGRLDGQTCERMRVSVTSREPVFFGTLVGRTGYTVTRSATVRARYTPSTRIPALWLLDPWGCTSLAVSGGSRVTVGTSSPGEPGIIAVDSDGSACTGSQRTVSATGAGTQTRALPTSGTTVGSIDLFALPRNAIVCGGYACDPADVAAGRLSPQPRSAARRATRLPVDWRYDCRASYPDFHGVGIDGCPFATPGYVGGLRAAIGTTGVPGGFNRWSNAGYGCNPSGTITVSGDWVVDCPGGLSIGNGTTLTFADGNVVLDGGISMTGGSLRFNTANPEAHLPATCLPPAVAVPCTDRASAASAFLYVRTGSINVTGGELRTEHVTTFLQDGYVKIAGGAPPTWTAPTEGPFAGLALWSELPSNKFQINGGAGARLAGTFFTPEAAPFTLSGGGQWGQQQAQFISYRLVVSGGGDLTLAPNGSSVELPTVSIRLIR